MKNIKVKLTAYNYDISHSGEAAAYNELCEFLKDKGHRIFDSISLDHDVFYRKYVTPFDGKDVELETKFIFDNQWNATNGARYFDWAESVVPNRNIKKGYWLELPQEAHQIREDTYKCGYCGAHYHKPEQTFCDQCLDSEYLEKDNLILLRLQPAAVSTGSKTFPELTKSEHEFLFKRYLKAQTVGGNSRAKAALEKQYADLELDLQRALKKAHTKHDGLKWLLDSEINIDNCIYYDHTQTFSFGWRHPVGEEVKSVLLDLLTEFPFEYEIK